MTGYVAVQLERTEKLEVLDARSSHSSRRVSVTLPRLRLDNDHTRSRADHLEKVDQTLIAVIQMNPHRYGKTEGDVEFFSIEFREIIVQFPVSIVGHEIETLEGHPVRQGVALPRSLDQRRIEIDAEQMNLELVGQLCLKKIPKYLREILRKNQRMC